MYGQHRVIGILAHVDAGKTTLAEGLLYTAGVLRNKGRVDHQDAFLDHFALERQRGITIFSKQALFSWESEKGKRIDVTLLDTPGHVDFSAEMERTLQVLDYAILVISGADGVQGHTLTLWGLLKRYGIPTFLFVNKMDQPGTDEGKLLRELQEKLNANCVAFTAWDNVTEDGNGKSSDNDGGYGRLSDERFCENLSVCDESLLEEYLETGGISSDSLGAAIADRKVFPVFFGSALQVVGVRELLETLADDTLDPEYPEEFGARVFKISRDKQGNRLTHLKITGGCLKAKQFVGNARKSNAGRIDAGNSGTESDRAEFGGGPAEKWEEKVDQIRLYNGLNYQVLQEAPAGTICAVTGLTKTKVGDGLGMEEEVILPTLEPVMTYECRLPEGSDRITALGKLRKLEEEEPLLHVMWKESLQEIHVQTMGEVQNEILKTILRERFGLDVTFENGSIVYKETLAEPVLGVGHYEPLRHYAEVQLLLEPGERGSGLQFASYVSEDDLDKNWQRLIMTHVEERTHPGVLMGAEVTDLRISIVGGKAHIKHTEGGDFRQATYRAIRQGLRSGRNILLEPVFDFCLELPVACMGRAMTDIQRMQGRFETPLMEGESVTIRGTAPVSTMQDYQREVVSYSKGLGRLSCTLKGYEPCHNPEEVLDKMPYDPDGDTENPTASIFCSHGAGTVIPWDRVYEYAHIPLREDFLEAACRYQEETVFHETVSDKAFLAMAELGKADSCMAESGKVDSCMAESGKVDSYMAKMGAKEVAGERPQGLGIAGAASVRTKGARNASSPMDRIISQEEINAIFEQGRRNQNRKESDKRGYRRYHRGNRRTIEAGYHGQSETGNRKPETTEITGASKTESRRSEEQGIAGSIETEGLGIRGYAGSPKSTDQNKKKTSLMRENCILVDGYNVIHAWPYLKELMEVNIASARDRLVEEMSNYQGFVGGILILVFDAYKVKGNPGSIQKWNNIYVVYTKEAETADQYIEKTVHEIASKYRVTVATSDGLEQMIIWGDGAARMSSMGLLEDYERQKALAREKYGIMQQ